MQTPSQVQALLAANRLEARPRSPEFNRALRAEVRDPTWLLARQWQMREFRAEDRGTPAAAAVRLRQQPLSCLALPSQPTGRPYHPQHQPLEAAVEAQPRAVGLGLRLQMGQYWRRLLRTALAAPGTPQEQAAALAVWAAVYPLRQATEEVAAAQQATTTEALALVQLTGSQAIDGYALYQDLLAPYRATLAAELTDTELLADALKTRHPAQDLLATDFPNTPFATHTGPLDLEVGLATNGGRASLVALADGLDVLARQFIAAFHRLYFLGEDNATWSTEAMAYGFSLGAGTAGLATTHYPGGATLPWYAVDRAAAAPALAPPATPPAATIETRTLLPTEVLFPGAPAARWWEFEDRRVDFGQVTGHAADWGRMLLQEFMFLYQNDWHTVPYAVYPGTVCQVESLEVTDVFGHTYRIEPAGAGQQVEDPTSATPVRIDNDANRWRLFAQTDPAAPGTPALAPVLYVPAAVRSPQAGRPSEQVSFRREEATNLVWAVESIVPDGFAGGLDGGTAATHTAELLRSPAPATPAADPADAAAYRYQLASTVPENWLPFVPVLAADGRPALEQGLLPRQVPGRTFLPTSAAYYVQPRTPLLQLHGPTAPYVLHEHEVPATGVRVEGRSYRARWLDGRVLHWFGRQRGPAQPGGSSGLAFDLLTPGAS